MKRRVNVLTPIILLAILVMGAAPSNKNAADADVSVSGQTTAPTAAPSAETLRPESELDLKAIGSTELPTQPDAATTAATYEIDWYSINGGGTVNASSTNYKMGASIGQSVAGAASSASYQMGIGFWYGAGSSGSCVCDCHGDPAPIGSCDGVQDVLDVVNTVNVAFRGSAAILDPNVNCPFETTDVNCSASTDVLDVVRMVNVAFRGANAATEFCTPCP